jgi:hypothetical protein
VQSEHFVVCRYFNAKGSCLHEIAVESAGQVDPSNTRTTDSNEGALAVQALLVDVTTERAELALARKVRSVSVDGRAPVPIADVLQDLEAGFGAPSTQWAHAIFTHLKLVPPTIQ